MNCRKCGSYMDDHDTECKVCGWQNDIPKPPRKIESHQEVYLERNEKVGVCWIVYSVLFIIVGLILLYKGMYYYNCEFLDPYDDVLWVDKERGAIASLPFFIGTATSFLSAVGTGIIYQLVQIRNARR